MACLEIGLVDAEALGLQEDVLREASPTLCYVLSVVDARKKIGGDLVIGVVLDMTPMLAVEHLARCWVHLRAAGG